MSELTSENPARYGTADRHVDFSWKCLLKRWITPNAVLIAGIVWLALEFVVAGKFSVVYTGDNGEIIVPGLMRQTFTDVAGAFWDGFSAAGSDRRSLGFSAPIDVWLFAVLPGWLASAVRVTSQIIFSVVFTYLLARRTFRFDPWPSVFTAFVYASFTQGMLVNASVAYQPALIFALTCLLDRKSDAKRWLFAAGAILLVVWTGYFSRLVPFVGAFVVAWFMFVDTRRSIVDWIIFLSASVATVVLRLEDIVALMVQSPLSHLPLVRWQRELDDAAREIASFLTPRLTPASAALGLFLFGLVSSRLSAPRMKGVSILFVLGVLSPLIAISVQLGLIPKFPFLYGYDMTRFIALAAGILPFAGGYGMQALCANLGARSARGQLLPKSSIYRGAVAAAVAILVYASFERKWENAYDWITHGGYTQNFDSPVIEKLARDIRSGPMPVRAETFQMYPAYLHAYGIETAGGYQPVFFRRYYEFFGKMMEPWILTLNPDSHELWGSHAKKMASQAGPGAFRGDRLMLVPHDHRAERRLSDLYYLNMLSLANVGYFISRDRLTDQSLEPVSEALKPWSALTVREKVAVNLKANFRGREHLYIYRNRDVMPRVFSVERIRVFDTGKQVLDAVSRASVAELGRFVHAERSTLPQGLDGARFELSSFRFERRSGDAIRLERESGEAALVVVSNAYSPYWACRADDVVVPLFPAYHAFWGIVVPSGAKRVDCRYEPPTAASILSRANK